MWPSLQKRFKDTCLGLFSRCVRFIIRCLGNHFCPLLPELASQMIEVYTGTHHSCFLYLGSILVDEFGTNKNCVPGLIQMVEVSGSWTAGDGDDG